MTHEDTFRVKPSTAGPSTNSQISKSIATSLICIRILTHMLATVRGTCMNCHLWFSLKKEDQYRYCRQNSKTKSQSVKKSGSKKGVPSKPNNWKYVYSYSMYSYSFPFGKFLASCVVGSRTSLVRISLHILKNESWIW